MKNEIKNSEFFKATHIEKVVYKKQGQDFFERLKRELGRRVTPTGNIVFTNFNLWCYAPNMDHPNFYIKMQLSNKKGSTFTEMEVEEFKDLINQINQWLVNHEPEIQNAILLSRELKKRALISKNVKDLLSDTSISTSAIDELLEEKAQFQEPTETELADAYIRYYNEYINTHPANANRRYQLEQLMLTLLPTNPEAFTKFKQAVAKGLDPREAYNEITDFDVNIQSGEIYKTPLDNKTHTIDNENITLPTGEDLELRKTRSHQDPSSPDIEMNQMDEECSQESSDNTEN